MSYQSYPNLPPQIPKRWFTYIVLVFCGFGAIVNLISLLVTGIAIAAIQGYIFYLINARKLRGHKIYFVINGLSMLLFGLTGYYTEVGILGLLMYLIYLDYNYINKHSVGSQYGYGANQPNSYSNQQYATANAPQYSTGNPAYYPTSNAQTNMQNQQSTPNQVNQGVPSQNATEQNAGIPLNFCGNCGKKILEPDAQFCQNCGAPIKK